MNKYFHKIVTCAAFIVISSQPISASIPETEEAIPPLVSSKDDKNLPFNKQKVSIEKKQQIIRKNRRFISAPQHELKFLGANETKSGEAIFKNISNKAKNILAWINTDIEADLH